MPAAKPKVKGSSARKVADQVSARLGKTVTPKTIRQWARDHMTRFQDEGYTVHAYSAAEVRQITAAFVKSDARRQASKAGDQATDDSDDEQPEA